MRFEKKWAPETFFIDFRQICAPFWSQNGSHNHPKRVLIFKQKTEGKKKGPRQLPDLIPYIDPRPRDDILRPGGRWGVGGYNPSKLTADYLTRPWAKGPANLPTR